MKFTLAHSGPGGLPLHPDVAGVVLIVGLAVFLVIAYDYVRRHPSGGD